MAAHHSSSRVGGVVSPVDVVDILKKMSNTTSPSSKSPSDNHAKSPANSSPSAKKTDGLDLLLLELESTDSSSVGLVLR